MSADEMALRELLRPGARNVASSYYLAERLGVPQRAVGFMVNRLRRAGHLIGSVHGSGYYIISTREELESTLSHIERRKKGIDQTIDALTRAWETA